LKTQIKNGYKWRNDLVAINICRGREHGIPSYNAYREHCKLPKADYFDDFADTMNYGAIRKLEKLYRHVNDVDLFVGLNSEEALPGALVGHVSACLLVKQFEVLAEGDRFFFTHHHHHHQEFTEKELFESAKGALLVTLCITVDVEKVPLDAFEPPHDRHNPLVHCVVVREIYDEILKHVPEAERLDRHSLKTYRQVFIILEERIRIL